MKKSNGVNEPNNPVKYDALVKAISKTYNAGQKRAYQAVNVTLVETYWAIGRHIVEFEQGGKATSDYGA